jgi:hypothetical protein
MNNSPQHTLSIGYNEKYVGESVNTKVLGLQIYNHQNWKNHIYQLVPKWSDVCYAVRLFHLLAALTLSNQFILPVFTL